LFLFALLTYRRRVKKVKPVFPGIAFIVLLILLFLLNNYGREKPKAIITSNQVYIMDGPSPGAEVLEIIGRGHRVDILGRKDVWTRINWKDREAFVKENNLQHIRL
jgi:hypothetical protein